MNRIFLIGNLVADPQMKATAGGKDVCEFRIAVSRSYQGKDGERKAEFFYVSTFGKRAESCSRYLKKGSRVAVIGELTTEAFLSKAGKPYAVLDVTADLVEFLTYPAEERKTEENGMTEEQEKSLAEQIQDIDPDQIPF